MRPSDDNVVRGHSHQIIQPKFLSLLNPYFVSDVSYKSGNGIYDAGAETQVNDVAQSASQSCYLLKP